MYLSKIVDDVYESNDVKKIFDSGMNHTLQLLSSHK